MPHQFASGADEKVVRVFLAPKPFLTTLENISGIATNESKEDSGNTKRAIKGTVPELGLSNKVRKRPKYLHVSPLSCLVCRLSPRREKLISFFATLCFVVSLFIRLCLSVTVLWVFVVCPVFNKLSRRVLIYLSKVRTH